MEKTVKMIADDIFEKLHDIDDLYTLEELAEMCRYKDGNILDSIESESSGSPALDIGFKPRGLSFRIVPFSSICIRK